MELPQRSFLLKIISKTERREGQSCNSRNMLVEEPMISSPSTTSRIETVVDMAESGNSHGDGKLDLYECLEDRRVGVNCRLKNGRVVA